MNALADQLLTVSFPVAGPADRWERSAGLSRDERRGRDSVDLEWWIKLAMLAAYGFTAAAQAVALALGLRAWRRRDR